ncbi:MAG: hypothetical protein KKB70_00735 [Proteobacteria bacterium]|nr:hypothetical protein [Pseudomonadota bacterium]
MAFTSWSDELTKLLDALSSQDLTVQSYTADGDAVAFRSLGDLRKHIEWVRLQADLERGIAYGRTCAGQRGRG